MYKYRFIRKPPILFIRPFYLSNCAMWRESKKVTKDVLKRRKMEGRRRFRYHFSPCVKFNSFFVTVAVQAVFLTSFKIIPNPFTERHTYRSKTVEIANLLPRPTCLFFTFFNLLNKGKKVSPLSASFFLFVSFSQELQL